MFQCSNVLAWTPPQSPPPQDNVPQPLNTGPTGQAKQGGLTVGKTTPIQGAQGVIFGAHSLYGPGVDFIFTENYGYVGIGTTDPQQELHIQGDVVGGMYYDLVDPNYYFDLSGATTSYSLLLNKSVGIGTITPDGKLEVRQIGSADIFNLYDNTTNVLTVLDGGNVGIGISAPTGLLDVNNKLVVSDQQITMNVPLNLAAAGDISIASDLQFTSPTASYIKSYAPLYLQSGDSNHSYDLTLRAFNAGEVVSDAQLNLSNNRITNLATPIADSDAATKGYVDDIEYWQVTGSYLYPTSMDYAIGIGTTTPSVDLEVYDSSGATQILINSLETKSSGIYFKNGYSGIYQPANSEDLRFWLGTDDTDVDDRMTITSDGKVGIGTTSPDGPLHVVDLISNKQVVLGDSTNIGSIKHAVHTKYIEYVAGPDTTSPGIYLAGKDYSGSGIFDAGDVEIAIPTTSSFTVADISDSPLVTFMGTGGVGIGTTSPDQKLQVNGNIRLPVTGGKIAFGSAGTSPTDYLLLQDMGVGSPILQLIHDGSSKFYIEGTSGNVGIGVTSPIGKLHIDTAGATDTIPFIVRNGTNNLHYMYVDAGGDARYTLHNAAGSEKVAIHADGDTHFSGGNVGIGTTSPGHLLELQSSTENPTIQITGHTTNNRDPYLTFADNAADLANVWYDRNLGDWYFDNLADGALNDIRFRTSVSGTPINALTIKGGGNVGIGTTNPGYLLHISKNGLGGGLAIQRTDAAPSLFTLLNSGAMMNFAYDGNSFGFNKGISVGSTFGSGYPPSNGMIIEGNVGIGTTTIRVSDKTKLDVEGGDIYIDDFSGTDDKFAATVGYVKSTSGASVTGDANYIPKYGADGLLTETTAPIYELNNYIGIGTTVPESELHIDDGLVSVRNTTDGSYKTPTERYYLTPRGYVDDAIIDQLILAGDPDWQYDTDPETKVWVVGKEVGIGTNDPLTDLDVLGSVDISNQISAGSAYITNNVEVATGNLFVTSGSVGIGTDDPQYKLDISGSMRINTTSPALNFRASGGGQVASLKMTEVVGVSSRLGFFDDSSIERLSILTRAGATQGNIGIGTTSPGAKLDVSHDSAPILRLTETDTTVGAYQELGKIEFYNSDLDAPGVAASIAAKSQSGFGQPIALYFKTGTAGTIDDRMIIDYDGEVGIGTTVPQSKLDVDGLIKMRSSTIVADEDVINKGYLDSAMIAGDNDWAGVGGDPTLAGEIYHTGNVGIGTTNPGANLHIAKNGNVILLMNTNAVGNEAGIYLTEGASATPTQNGAYLMYDGSGNKFHIKTGGGGAYTEKLTVERDTGNVAIGTTSAGYKLDILSSDAIDSYLRVQRYDADVQAGIMLATGASTPLWTMYVDSGSREDLFFEYNGEVPFTISEEGWIGIGTYSPDTLLTIANDEWISAKDSAGTGHVNMFKVNASNEIEVGGTLNIGTIGLAEDSGVVTLVNMPVSSTPSAGTEESYSFAIDSESILKVYSEADGTGGIQNKRVGIGTTSPQAALDVYGDIEADNVTLSGRFTGGTLHTTSGATINNSVFQENYGVYVGGSDDNYFAGNVGIGLNDPGEKLSVAGNVMIGDSAWSDGTTTGDLAVQGSVGIGVTDPGAKLEVVSDFSIKLDPTNGYGLTLGRAGANYIKAMEASADLYIQATDDIYLSPSDDIQLPGSGIWKQEGNVGIGTTIPQGKLQITGDEVRIGDSGTPGVATGDGDLYVEDDLEVDNDLNVGDNTQLGNSYSDTHNIYGITHFKGSSNDMTFDGTGNVGIGTNDPQYSLDIRDPSAGEIYLPDSYWATGTNDFAATIGYLHENFAPITGGAGSAFVQGGNSFGELTTLGTNDNYDLTFETNNSRRMTIDTAGNVGIGTTSPGTYKIDIYGGDARVTENVNGAAVMYVSNPNLGESARSLFTLQNNTGSVEIGLGGSGRIDGWANDFWLWNGATGGNTRFGTNGTERMRITSAGNTGIGTTSPQGKLHVQTASDVEIFRTEDETGSEAMVIDKDGNVIISL